MDSARDGPGGSISKTTSCALRSPCSWQWRSASRGLSTQDGRGPLGQQMIFARPEGGWGVEARGAVPSREPAVSGCVGLIYPRGLADGFQCGAVTGMLFIASPSELCIGLGSVPARGCAAGRAREGLLAVVWLIVARDEASQRALEGPLGWTNH